MMKLYWKLQSEYEIKYGKNTVVLIEKGGFYESYEYNNIGNAKLLSKILNMNLTKSNNNKELSLTNPYMAGFPTTGNWERNLGVLSSSGINIVLVKQVWDKNNLNIIDRKVCRVITPGTYMEEPPNEDCYNICGLFFPNEKETYLCTIDLSIGKVTLSIHKEVNTKEDVQRQLLMHDPKETIVLINNNNNKIILDFDNIQNITIKNINDENEFLKNCYQQEILTKVYPENINIDDEPGLRVILCYLINFIYCCHPAAIENLQVPSIIHDENILTLHNNAINQLNLWNVKKIKKPNCLFDIINKTSTTLGRRKLKELMLMPYTNKEKIKNIYDDVEKYQLIIDKLEKELQNIHDVERLSKRLWNKASFNDLENFKDSYIAIRNVYKILSIDTLDIDILIKQFESTWDFTNKIFQKTINYELDNCKTIYNDANMELKKIIEKYKTILEQKKDCIYIDCDKDGFYVYTTIKKGEYLKQKLKSDIDIIKSTKTSCRISNKCIEKHVITMRKMNDKYNELFTIEMNKQFHNIINSNYEEIIKINEMVKYIDVIKSMAKVSKMYGYTRPIIKDCTQSFIKATNIRHAIIERINENTRYIGNDIEFNTKQRGILLYGMNSSGKSSFSKSIALCIILAQMGCFVPSDYFEYSPFTQLFVRINSDDNMFKCLSSFGVEMMELKQILQCADKKSLVIGDELCKGTEDISATALVSSSVEWLLNNDITFIFATHLHKLPDILKNSKLSIKHLKCEFNKQLQKIVFYRKLEDGPGDSLYGIEIARSILECPNLINNAMQIRNNLINKPNKILKNKKSKYNSKIFMNICEHCKSPDNLHTHHNIEQHEYENESVINNTLMNDKHNLIVLCQKCHQDVHNNKLFYDIHDIGGKREIIFHYSISQTSSAH